MGCDLDRVLCVIPARAGSAGFPGKNLAPLCGLPLIAHSILCAQYAGFQHVLVSTDGQQIAEIATSFGADVPFLRPADLASSTAPMLPVLRHALGEAVHRADIQAVLLLDPTSPARQPEEIVAAVDQLLASPGLDGVVSCSTPSFNPFWVGVVERDGAMTRAFPDASGVTRRQDAPQIQRINGSIYVWRTEFIRRSGDSWIDEGRFAMMSTPDIRSHSIDSEADLTLLQVLIDAGLVYLPWMATRGR